MGARDLTLSVLEWDEQAVIAWLSGIGFSQYAHQIRAHNISGDVLTNLDQKKLIEMGVRTISQRDAILKAVYYLKLSHNVPIHADHYVSPFQIEDYHDTIILKNLHRIVREQAPTAGSLRQPVPAVRARLPLEEQPLNNNSSFEWVGYARSPTRIAMKSEAEPQVTPSALEHDIFNNSTPTLEPTQESHLPPDRAPSRFQQSPATSNIPINDEYASSDSDNTSTGTVIHSRNTFAPKPRNGGLKNGLKSSKVSLEDPTWKVLPAALRKYRIDNDGWQNYAMFICYGSKERCLSYDEKPLLLFRRLKNAKKSPVCMLKHIRDIHSPIIIAQQKQAVRRMAKESGAAVAVSASTSTATSDTMTSSTEHKQKDRTSPGDEDRTMVGKDMIPVPSLDITYAVAIYPYMAEQEDELDVVVGDTFIVLQRDRGWWVVQRDPSGSGTVENDPFKQGRVPAGCLLETSVPVASAIAKSTGCNPPADDKPILPVSIISTSFPKIALVDYIKKGEGELDLKKDDILRVFKNYNYWSYVVKEDGARGWVPSWFIGKVTGAGAPSTLSTASNSGAGMQDM